MKLFSYTHLLSQQLYFFLMFISDTEGGGILSRYVTIQYVLKEKQVLILTLQYLSEKLWKPF